MDGSNKDCRVFKGRLVFQISAYLTLGCIRLTALVSHTQNTRALLFCRRISFILAFGFCVVSGLRGQAQTTLTHSFAPEQSSGFHFARPGSGWGWLVPWLRHDLVSGA